MIAIFETRWRQGISKEEEILRKTTWLNVTKDLTNEQIKFGIEYCETLKPLDDKGQAWPPNPREFLEYCRMMPKPQKTDASNNEIGKRITELRNHISWTYQILREYGDKFLEQRKQDILMARHAAEIELRNIENIQNKAQC